MNIPLTLQIHEEDGSVWAEVAELPGCFASGKDLDELMEAMNEAVSLYLDDNPEAQAAIRRLAQPDEQVVDFSMHLARRQAREVPRLEVEKMQANLHYEQELIEA